MIKDKRGSASITVLVYAFAMFALFAMVADVFWLYNAKIYVRHSLNLALKAACTQIDTTVLQDPNNPRIVIKPTEAQQSFYNTLRTNLRTDSLNNPQASSIISGPFEVVYFKVVNSNEVPFIYSYTYPYGVYTETITEPGATAIIKVPIKLTGFMRVAVPSASTTSYIYIHSTVSPKIISKHLEDI